MKSSDNPIRTYFSKLGTMKTLVWVASLGVIAAYGLLDPGTTQPTDDYYYPQDQYAPPMPQDPYAQPMPQSGQQPPQYQPGNQPFPSSNQSQPMRQTPPLVQSNGGYPNGSANNDPSNTPGAYPQVQGSNYQRPAPTNYGY